MSIDDTAPGATSSGGASPTPNWCMPGGNLSPSWTPTVANVVLHETVKLCASVPPHVSWPKFDQVLSEAGRGIWFTFGNGVSGVTVPVSRPTVVVTTLNVEPGA